MAEPPFDPRDATAALVTDVAEAMAETLLALIASGHITQAATIGVIENLLHPNPTDRRARARQLVLEYVLLRLSGLPPGSGRA